MGQAGIAASATPTDGGGLLLSSTSILSIIVEPTVFLPITSFRAKTDGVAQKASGSTQAPLSYTNLPSGQWHTGSPITGADFEIFFDSLTNTATGPAATFFGSARDTFINLGTQRSWNWQKNTSSFGLSQHVILIEIREIATPSNTTGVRTFTFKSQVEA